VPAAQARTRNRCRMGPALIRRIMAGAPGPTSLGIADARLGPEQLGKPDGYDRGSGWWAVEQEDDATIDPVDPHLGPNEDVLPGGCVHPGIAVSVVQERRIRHGRLSCRRSLHLGRLDPQP